MTIKLHSAVSFHYNLTDESGTELDSSFRQEPMSYLHGTDMIIPGLEVALEGRVSGEILSVIVVAAEAYGPVNEEMIEEVPRDSFRDVDSIEVGMQFEAQTEQGGSMAVTVIALTEDSITVDGNHPLAGKTLHFDVSIEEIRDATAKELEHGHVHGPGGHQH